MFDLKKSRHMLRKTTTKIGYENKISNKTNGIVYKNLAWLIKA